MTNTGTTIQTEIERLTKAKSDIKTAIINKGGTISDTATIDKYAAAIDGISAGGGKNKKLKINVVTINPEHLYNDIIFIGYTDSLINGSLPIVFDFNSGVGTDGTFVNTIETEILKFNTKLTLNFEYFKEINFPEGTILCSIYTKSGENAMGEKQWSHLNGYESLNKVGQWCEVADYEMIGDGSVEYTIVFNVNKVDHFLNTFPKIFNYTIIRDDRIFNIYESFMLPSSHTFTDGVGLNVNDINNARILGCHCHVDYFKKIYVPSYYFTIITNSNTSDINVNITDTRLSSEQRVRNFYDFNIIDSANLASSGNITLDYTNKTISLNCHLDMCDMFKGIFLIHTIRNVSGGAEN